MASGSSGAPQYHARMRAVRLLRFGAPLRDEEIPERASVPHEGTDAAPEELLRRAFGGSMNRHATFEALRFLVLLSCLFPMDSSGQTPKPPVAKLDYELVPEFFQLPPGENFVESAGIAVNSRGHIYVFHRGKHPLMEFDATGGFIRSIADDLFVSAHAVRVDASDNIWTADVGSHVVLKLSPEGRVLLALGRMRIPGDDVAHFNQPTDVAFDRAGNIYVTDGYGNSRVLKFDKYGNFLTGWGMKGSAPGQFDLPHTIAIDGDLVYVGDRENARIQIFDTNGRFLKEWRDVGHPFGLFVTPDHAIYMSDAIAGRILKLSTEGGIIGIYGEHGRGPGRLGDPHQLTVGKDGSIFTANVVNWRPQKFRPSKGVAEFRPNDSPRARRYENSDPSGQ
jgi:DNA-binding beta-propeller fold protein YncE